MKKRAIWISLMSALLCLPLLLAACDNTKDTDTDSESETSVESGTETVTPEETVVERPTIEDEDVDYKALIDQWKTYISPVGASANNSYADYSYITIDAPISGNLYGNFTVNESVIDDADPISPGKKTTSVYNGNDLIKKFEYLNYNSAGKKWTITYDFMRTLAYGNVMEIKKTVYTSTDLTATPIVWEDEVTYLYYDIDGYQIGEGSETRATDLSHSIILGDKTYHIDSDGHVFFVTHVTEAYKIDDAYSTTLEISDNEIYRYSVLGYTLQVLDKDYNVATEFKMASGDQWYILDNGNVFIFRATQLADNATKFDYDDGSKYDVKHMMLDVSTGEISEFEASWVPTKVLTNESTEEYEIKANCFYAEVNRIVDGKLSNETEFVIFDNQLKEVAKLPSILKNQRSLENAIDSSSFVISVAGISDSYASYEVNTRTGTVERYVAVDTDRTLDGGYIIGNKVYTNNGTEVFDLTDTVNHSVIAGNLYYTTRGTYTDIYDNSASTTIAHIGYISDGVFMEKTISTVTSVEKLQNEEGGWTIKTYTERVSYNSTFGLYVVNMTVTTSGEEDVQKSYRLYNRNGSCIKSDTGEATITSNGNVPQLRVTTSSDTTIYTIK